MRYRARLTGIVGLAFLCLCTASVGREAEVRGRVSVVAQNGTAESGRNNGVVVWLTPLSDEARSESRAQPGTPHLKLVQKGKRFSPHILAVQLGSWVDFPNRDPFFHNVFSLFEGKRFDLGLYEAGSTRSVRFDRPGICYIFCNIHPQMSAVVVVVDTPYFTLANDAGEFLLSSVRAGNYRLNVWEEHCTPETLKKLSHEVVVGQVTATIEPVQLREARETVVLHPNKYGSSYDPQVFSDPIYTQP